MHILAPLSLGQGVATNRLMFGPHVTNLGTDERTFSERHVAYYERRARGGCGIIVLEGTSVHASDWPYERAPLASECSDSYAPIVKACHQHGALVIASLDHSGGQGSSAYSQLPLLAPSRVPEVNSREVPKWMEESDIAAVIDGFVTAAHSAVSAGCDGVEINIGQHSLVRQFLSGLTNHRSDAWGEDRTLFARTIIEKVRAVVGDAIMGIRLSCDELAPWAGITPEMAAELAPRLVEAGLNYIVVVRGAIFSAEKTRPDFHEPEGFNRELTAQIRSAVSVPVFLQGSIVDIAMANEAIAAGICDGVEMTRAHIADPDIAHKARNGAASDIRPCIRCNQTCQVRDARNPIVTCVVEPTSGHELSDPQWYSPASPKNVAVIGAGPAGLEAAYTAARRGHRVSIYEREAHAGGVARIAGPGASFVAWLQAQCLALGVEFHFSCNTADVDVSLADYVLQCTGSVPGVATYSMSDGSVRIDVVDVMQGKVSLPDDGVVVLHDPIGGPIAIALAEWLGNRATLVTPDNIAGNELSRSGDLAPANVRLAQRGATVVKRALVRSVNKTPTGVDVEVQDRFSGEMTVLGAVAFVDCGFRLPSPSLQFAANGAQVLSLGDCVAPRTVLEAVLEARRSALML